MSYRIAGIDVHKKMLAVVVSDVRNRKRVPVRATDVWQQPRTTAIAGCVASRANRRRSSHGIDGPILENQSGERWKGIGSRYARKREGARRKVRNVASGSSAIEPRTSGAQEGFSLMPNAW